MITGRAMEMRLRLSALRQRHRVELDPVSVPMTAPTLCAQVVEGYAMTSDIDADRCRFRGHAFGLVRKATPLLYRHDPDQIAGEIEELKYTGTGALYIRARIEHPEARRCNAFSVAGKVLSYRLHHADSPNFFAEIDDATLEEISLTDRPSNAHALVTRRYPASPLPRYFDFQKARIEVLKEMLALLPEVMISNTNRNSGSRKSIETLDSESVPKVRPPTSFGSMVAQLNAGLEA